MRNVVALAAVLASGVALAADLPARTVAPMAPAIVPFSWQGFYVGVNAGWSFGTMKGSLEVPAASSMNATARGVATGAGKHNSDQSAFTGGLTVGYNYQIQNIVLGVEGDLNYLGLNKSDTGAITTVGTRSGRTIDKAEGNLLATLRLRAGYSFDRTMLFMTGGVAFTDAKFKRNLDWTFADGCVVQAFGQRCHSGSATFQPGWTLGAGIEHAYSNNLSVKLEYLYTDFGKAKFTSVNTNIPAQSINHSAGLQLHTIRAGLNYRF